jgi:polysaccharide transporter, PST family
MTATSVDERGSRLGLLNKRLANLGGGIRAQFALTRLVKDPCFVNSSSWVGARAVAGLVRIGVLLAIARAYGPVEFGQLSLAISVVEILRAFSEFGVDTISIRKFAQTTPEERHALLGGIVGTKLIMAGLFYFGGAAVLWLIGRDRTELALGAIIGISLFFVGALGAISSFLQSCFSMSKLLHTTLWTSGLSACLAGVAIANKLSLWWVILAFPLADALNLFLVWRKLEVPVRVRFRLNGTFSLLRESFPVGFGAISAMLYFRLDNLFIFRFSGAAALGLYAACYRLLEPALIVPGSFATTSYAFLSSSDYQLAGPAKLSRLVFRTMWPAYVFIASTVVFFLLTGKVLLLRFLHGYQAAYPILLVLILVLTLRTMNASMVAILNSRARYSVLAKITVIDLAINLLLVSVLVPRWGALGAAWAAVVTEIASAVMQVQCILSSLSAVAHPLSAGSLTPE